MYLRHITKEEGLVMLQKHGLIQVFGLSPGSSVQVAAILMY